MWESKRSLSQSTEPSTTLALESLELLKYKFYFFVNHPVLGILLWHNKWTKALVVGWVFSLISTN